VTLLYMLVDEGLNCNTCSSSYLYPKWCSVWSPCAQQRSEQWTKSCWIVFSSADEGLWL